MLEKTIIKDLKKLANPEKAKILMRFFKTGPGQYGEGDKFLGITVPNQRILAKKYFKQATLKDVDRLLSSPIHELRLTALIILTYKFKIAEREEKTEIFEFYVRNTKNINNWDLVDLSAPNIVGAYLIENPQKKKILYLLSKSDNLWEKRISIIATYAFIKNNEFSETLKIAKILLADEHDLIHKAVGWMLRELGKKDQKEEEEFLKNTYKTMPRTMLRYAIERFDEEKRQKYLKSKI